MTMLHPTDATRLSGGYDVTEQQRLLDETLINSVAHLHPDHAANAIIGQPRGPETAHLYRAFDFFLAQQRLTSTRMLALLEQVQKVGAISSDLPPPIDLSKEVLADLVDKVRVLEEKMSVLNHDLASRRVDEREAKRK